MWEPGKGRCQDANFLADGLVLVDDHQRLTVDDARSASYPDTGVAEIMLFDRDSQFIGEIL